MRGQVWPYAEKVCWQHKGEERGFACNIEMPGLGLARLLGRGFGDREGNVTSTVLGT
jgi:hypothetical protein